MNPITIDMAEVLRLTKAGQLTDALARLQVGGSAATKSLASRTRPVTGKSARDDVLDLVPPTHSGGSWTPPTFTSPPSSGRMRDALSRGLPDLVQSVPGHVGSVPSGSGLEGPLGFDRPPGLTRTPAAPPPVGSRFEERSFSNEAGTRPYKLYIPSGYTGTPVPLVVMLHGCTQSPDDFAAGTRMNELAEEQGFLVIYPGQPTAAHPQRCWKWFSAGDQQRGRGEPSIIAGMTRSTVAEFGLDPTRVYVAGMSAGAAAAAIMGSEYPDVYAAVGIHSGLACGSASDLPSALAAMRGSGTVRARGTKKVVPTIVFHGDSDKTVAAVNGEQVIAQQRGEEFKTVRTSGASEAGVNFTRTAYTDDAGREWLVHCSVSGGGHAWAGGSSAGSYTDPQGPDASREMLRFFVGHTNEVL